MLPSNWRCCKRTQTHARRGTGTKPDSSQRLTIARLAVPMGTEGTYIRSPPSESEIHRRGDLKRDGASREEVGRRHGQSDCAAKGIWICELFVEN